jgi:TFIIF-interacting CTD phosphatase-like protein
MSLKKINIVLDLDNTLISAIDEKESKYMKSNGSLYVAMRNYAWKKMDDEYIVFARPHLQDFLSWLFANFNVSVWTAASKLYATFIIDNFILAGHKNRKLDFILFSHHCKKSLKMHNHQKKLSMMCVSTSYDVNNTYIIDDHKDVHSAQPDKCFKIKQFDVTKSQDLDIELKKIATKLKSLL